MAYLVKECWTNGYRCSCCSHDNDSEYWEDSKEIALSKCTVERIKEHLCGEYSELRFVEVTDGSTGKMIANLYTTWPFLRSKRYQYTKIYGELNEQLIEEIIGSNGKTWAEILAE